MFPGRYFPDRYFAPRYWPVGGTAVIVPGPFRIEASQAWTPGSVLGQKGSFAGSAAGQYHSAGSEKGQSV